MHTAALTFYEGALSSLPPLNVVEFGACNINGSVRSVCSQATSWLGLDIQAGPGVDLVQDAATWETGERFDLVICAEVFEHTPDWRLILAKAYEVLVVGGLLVASCATNDRPPHSAFDGGPLREGEFYRNVPEDEMSEALDQIGFTSIVRVADGHFGNDDLYITAVR